MIWNYISLAKPGGYILLAYVTIHGHLRDLASREPSRLVGEWEFYRQYLNSGEYTMNSEKTSFRVRPADLPEGFVAFRDQASVEKVLSCEGFLGAGGAKIWLL